ncbi:MAG: DNA polymerase III subunit alpha, partial [Planctomycetes bacterium]|nr:DNA polymerase III subunit alpha [Planctomycetota bacterium]
TRTDRSAGNIKGSSYHLLLLAQDETGFRNLLKLSSRAYMEGFYYRPRIDRELLSELNAGLICTTACLGGEVPAALLSGQAEHARKVAGEYLDIFGSERFFMEVQNQGLDEQSRLNPMLVELAKQLGVGLVGTNDVHFLTREHKPSHEILCCISTGKTIQESSMGDAYPPELYLKSPAEMRQALARWPQAADNTVRIAEMCNLELDFSGSHLPIFPTPDGQSDCEYLSRLAYEGLRRRRGDSPGEQYVQRLQRELDVISDKGYCSYFLIVNDLVQYARRGDIPAAPRGSGVATLLGYVLGMADVDPLKYGLLFERFTDPERREAPDIDIDICQEGRAKVIDYVRHKYGHVAQIITYGTLKARAVIRDVARVLDVPLPEVDQLCKKVPEGLNVTIDSAMAAEPDLRHLYDTDDRIHTLIDHARKLEGLARHAGVHAAGIVIASEKLEQIVPLCRQANSEDAITQWDGPTCDKIGLMKIDFLGLRTLTIIQRTRELVRKRTGEDIDPETIPLDDPQVYQMFCEGRTAGVFQFESAGMKNVLTQIRPERIEELIATNAMYRPGPMELIPTYVARKHAHEHVPSLHPLVDDMLRETYGIMAYQEQVMQVLNSLGKLPLNRALTLIKAISKKKEKVITAERPYFLAGAKENGIDDEEAKRLFELILKFAGYGFNKAHSTRYAIVAYQSAFFKVHHQMEFMAATLTFEAGDSNKLREYLEECAMMGIKVGPPNINDSAADFTVVGKTILFGLTGIKGVGTKAVEAILAGRQAAGEFKDLYNFCESIDLQAVNRTALEALIKCGAFDGLGANRAEMIAAVDGAIQLGQRQAADQRSGQLNFLDLLVKDSGTDDYRPQFPKVQPWTEAQLLAAEKETLGFYITSHPLTAYGRELENLGSARLADLKNLPANTPVIVGCMIVQVRQTIIKQGRSAGQKMAMLTVEDLTGSAECLAFSDAYARLADLLVPEAMVFIRGAVDHQRQAPSIIVDGVIPIAGAVETLTAGVLLRLDRIIANKQAVQTLGDLLASFKGKCPLYLQLHPLTAPQIRATLQSDPRWYVNPQRELMKKLEELLGAENVVFKGKPATNGQNNRRRNNYSPSKPVRRYPAGAGLSS